MKRVLNSARRVPLIMLLLLSAYLLLALLGSGVLQLQLRLHWSSPGAPSSALTEPWIALSIHREFLAQPLVTGGGDSRVFWSAQLLVLLLTMLMPFLRPLAAVALTAGVGVAVVALCRGAGLAQHATIMQFELLSIGILLSLYALVVFVGEMRDKYMLAQVFSEFVPPQLVDQYMVDRRALRLDNEARQITVLFSDIHGFATISERLSPTVLAEWLDSYFDAVSQVIVEHGGTVDKFMGDSVMAIWGAPVADPQHGTKAVAAASALQRRMVALNANLRRRHLPEIVVGVGVSSGMCHVGVMGSRFRRTYTVVGDTVNIAQRLEKLTREYEVPVVISETTARLTKGWLYRELGTEYVKGRKRFVGIMQPIGTIESCSEQQRTWVQWHNRALALQQQGQYFESQAMLEKLRDDTGEIALYSLLIARLKVFKRRGDEFVAGR